MKIMNTSPLPKSISSIFPNKLAGTLAEVLFLFGIGMLAIAIHAKLRIPMQLPGRQGILFLAILVIGRGISRFPYAGTLICSGSAALLATSWLGFHEPLMPLVYILIGMILDSSSFAFGKALPYILSMALVCAIAWMCIPLIRLVITLFTGLQFTSFRYGIAWPVLTHLFFGLAGGLLGACILKISSRFIPK
ncbi:MAG: hypothetical protein V1733_05265 [bacterium]